MAEDNKARNIGYWILTIFIALGFAFAGVIDLIAGDEIVGQFTALGYPAYLPRFLGVCKLLGAVAIVAPKFPRLKEWAYAGLFFDLAGATYSHIANGDGADKFIAPIVLLVIAMASYILRPADRKLPDPTGV